MSEPSEMHEVTLEWGCITNLMDKISGIEDKIEGGWTELIDMIADAITMESAEKDTTKIFFALYQFLWRLYYRLKTRPEKRGFNQISKTIILGKEVYRVTNYNYDYFKWVLTIGLTDGITNDYIDIPKDKLSDKQQRAFDRRIGD